MTDLLKEAINCSDGDIIRIESDERRELRLPENVAGRPRAARTHHRRVVADRGAVSRLMTHLTPFFQFALAVVIPGALVILLAALLWTGRT
jgi:hypothetical protein